MTNLDEVLVLKLSKLVVKLKPKVDVDHQIIIKKKKKNLFLHIVDNTSINLFKLLNQQNGGDRQKAQYVPT